MNEQIKVKSIHSSRTLMFAELTKIMDHGIGNNNYIESLDKNVTGKLTKTNQEKTTHFLKQLYGFDLNIPEFKCFKYFWKISEASERPVISLLYAIGRDYLLDETSEVVILTSPGDKVKVQDLEENIERHHPGRYSENTKRSTAQNIASSWKQAGFIKGKRKNIRITVNHGYHTVVFALLMGYVNGTRGEDLLRTKWVKILELSEIKLLELIHQAAIRDLIAYSKSGGITVINLDKLLKTIG